MSFKEKMNELNFVERRMALNKNYSQEFFTFSKKAALSALSYLIDNASRSIEIYHKPITPNDENFKNNIVLASLRNNSKAKITYYSILKNKEKDIKVIKEYVGKNTEIVDLNFESKMFHHKEMVIDGKYLVITSLNFLTNNVVDNLKNDVFWLENFSIWVKRRDKK